jgi:toxin secretion/phage lysis holin
MNKVKAWFTAFLSFVASLLGVLAIPVLILVSCNVIDYATGIVASKYRDEKISSYKSFRGIAKKICMWLLVVIGALVDQLLIYAGETVGIILPFTFLVACVVAIWLICNEIISILENISDIGANLPPFLKPLIKNIQKQVENKADLKEDKKNVDKDKS